MCNPYAVAGVGLGIQTYSSYLNQKATAEAYQEQMDSQKKAAVTQMNYDFQNLEQQRSDAFDTAVQEMTNTYLNSMQLNSGVKNAVNETMEGRTANLIVRNVEGDTARAVASIKDNYDRKSNEIDLNKYSTYISTNSYLENLNASAPRMPSRMSNFLEFAGNAITDFTAAANYDNGQKIAKSSSATSASTNSSSTWGMTNYYPYTYSSSLGSGSSDLYGSYLSRRVGVGTSNYLNRRLGNIGIQSYFGG